MTWEFCYVAVFVVGLGLAAVTRLISDLRSLARHHLVVPHSDLHRPFLALLGRWLAIGMVLFGLVGLVVTAQRHAKPWTTLLLATAAGIAGILAALLMMRHPCAVALGSERATVVRDIQPGAYGQVRIEKNGVTVLMAAQSVDAGVIPAGAEVEVVDCSRSVLTVRLRSEA
ncbi:MAG: hypothetical protein B7Z68_10850 [Acidobacteria bacterium 21-70-11]|nr:MAG: hypothetical protein B7Z68_10850 [Acidobacteria bacterium 21-70-11]OYW00587.1 MAG: hypothetical protein B7Z61_13235 [Acidobacteria bacterium 37-71-11]HQT95696.1 hypothetical protein [Thermoanaerobaculaceae bacterium]HQU33828.1 hypothetical protein [Thermoanaerobaculaceae bacterium]